jgi:hypothetical protein
MIYKTLHNKLKIDHHEPTLKAGGQLRCSGRVNMSCSTCGTHRVTLVAKPVMVITTNGTYSVINCDTNIPTVNQVTNATVKLST